MRIGLMVLLLAHTGCSLYFDHGRDDPPPDAARYLGDAFVRDGSTTCDASAPADFGAACRAPEGAAIVLDAAQVPAHLAGRWWMCGGAAEFFGNVEFTADLRFYMLTEVNGEFVRNLGPTTSGTYSVLPGAADVTFSISQRFLDGSGASYPLRGFIENTPHRLALGGGNYVAIP